MTSPDLRTAPVIHLDTVVVGLDGSHTGRGALDWLERQQSRSVHLVRALSPGLELLEAGFQLDTARWSERSAEELAEHAGRVHRWAESVAFHVVEDQPADALLGIAHRQHADAIVVGTPRPSGRGSLVGADIARLVHRSDVPVVVVPDGSAATDARAVVAGVESPREVGPLLGWIDRVVGDAADVQVLEVLSPTVLALPQSEELARRIEDISVEQLAGALPDGFAGERQVVFQRPIDAYAAMSEQAGLIVVASHHRARWQGFLTGSLVHHLPTVAACPIAIVPVTDR